MKKIYQYEDVLGNTVRLKTGKDVFKEIKNEPCWIIESRKVFPISTNWDIFSQFKGKFYETDEDAHTAIKQYISDYKKKADKIGKNIYYEELSV